MTTSIPQLPTHPQCPKPPWTRTSLGAYVMPDGKSITEEDVASFCLVVEEYKKSYKEVSRERGRLIAEIKSALKSSGVSIMRNNLRDPLSCYAPMPYIEEAKRWVQSKAQREREEAEKRRASELTTRAILWLMNRGKVIGADFNQDNALSVANEIAYSEEVQRRVADGGYHDFSGQNCDDPCRGWDGVSRRCECGNRRVDWVQGDCHTFESPAVYGEAY